jgi:hypothetical protein
MMKRIHAAFWAAVSLTGAGCADNPRSVGYLDASSGGRTAGGGTGEGGSAEAGNGGRDTGYAGSAGAAGFGATAGAAGKPGSGGKVQSAGGSNGEMPDAAHSGAGSGGTSPNPDSGTDAGDPRMCGSTLCLSTTCVGLGCGLARCCKTDAGPVCIRGAMRCPGEPAETTLPCWPGSASKGVTATFDKTCSKDADCIIVEHWTGCCGASDISLKASEMQSFEAFEQTCGGQPPCGCCCDHVYAEDGYAVVAPAAARAVCFGGACIAVGQPGP